MSARILHGDCRQVLATLPDSSVDSIVTDPPYELGFMGKKWDASSVAYDDSLWRECLRVLKPGGHLLAFGGTRTYHRMACAIEDAGFEIRDSIHWAYGSGFPKSLDVSKAIDKQRHDLEDVHRVTSWVRAMRDAAGITNRDINNAFGFADMARHWTSTKSQPRVPTLDQVPTLLDVLGVAPDEVPEDIRRLLWDLNGRKGQPGQNWAKREVVGVAVVPGEPGTAAGYANGIASIAGFDAVAKRVVPITVPATDAARQWNGWGTALKPAHEPIVVARKPLAATVAANVLKHGTGALNIDECRVGSSDGYEKAWDRPVRTNIGAGGYISDGTQHTIDISTNKPVGGRWPANLVLTHAAACADECATDCPVNELDTQSGGVPGGASRFFTVTEWDPIADAVPFRYVAKPSKRERHADGTVDNRHPTVKPVALMRWLVRLVTPPGGVVLDPFTGSGTTGVAAVLEGFDFLGCEMTGEYLPIIDGRLAWAAEQTNDTCDTTSGTSPERGSHRNQPEHASQVSPDDHPNLFGDAA